LINGTRERSPPVNSFLLTWDGSDEAYDPDEYAGAIAQTSDQHEVEMQWSIGGRRSGVEAGDRVYLLRQRTDRGIVDSEPFPTWWRAGSGGCGVASPE
jgi:hypothetical protein